MASALLLLMCACGKKLDPIPPEAVLPGPVREFRLNQEGESLVLSWLFPRENLMGQPLTQINGFRLERCETKGVLPAKGCWQDFMVVADIDLAYPRVGQVQGEQVLYQDGNLMPDRRYDYRVAAYRDKEYPGAWSETLSHAWGVLPRAPQELEAQAGDRVAALAWTPVTQLKDGRPLTDLAGYHVYRRTKTRWTRLTPEVLTETFFQDVAVKNDVEYTYMVRALRRLGPDLLESENSGTRTVVPEDLTPPPPILNLVAAPTVKGVELSWDPSPAKDLAGYRVYRRQAGNLEFVLLTPDLVKKPFFVDDRIDRRQVYYYYVTAVDDSRRANESLPSEQTEVSF